MRRGNIAGRDRLTLQVLNPVKKPDGSVAPYWQDVMTITGKVIPLSAEVRLAFKQRDMDVTHKVRLEGTAPTWAPVSGPLSRDRGRLWPGLVRFVFLDAGGGSRVLLYQGSYSPGEAGRMLTITCREDAVEQQFPH